MDDDHDQATIHSSRHSHHTVHTATSTHRDSHDDYQARLSYPHTKLSGNILNNNSNGDSRSGSSRKEKRSDIEIVGIEMKESPSNNTRTTTDSTTAVMGDEKRRRVPDSNRPGVGNRGGVRSPGSDSEKKLGGTGSSGSRSASTSTDSDSGSVISTTLDGAGTTEGALSSAGATAGGGVGLGIGVGIDGAGDEDGRNEQQVERDSEGRPVVYKVYKRRWFGLVQLTLLNIIVSWDVSCLFISCSRLCRLIHLKLFQPHSSE